MTGQKLHWHWSLVEGSGAFSIPKCSRKIHVLGKWNKCPHPLIKGQQSSKGSMMRAQTNRWTDIRYQVHYCIHSRISTYAYIQRQQQNMRLFFNCPHLSSPCICGYLLGVKGLQDPCALIFRVCLFFEVRLFMSVYSISLALRSIINPHRLGMLQRREWCRRCASTLRRFHFAWNWA